MNCQWAHALTRFDCRDVSSVDGSPCLEIGTPFSLPDGSAINLYLQELKNHVRISDNGDTLFQLGGMGLDIWQSNRFSALRKFVETLKLHLDDSGELFMFAAIEHAASGFAVATAGMIGISQWASEKLGETPGDIDLPAKLQPFIIARNPGARFEVRPTVKGASRKTHTFDFLHGGDLIDVIPASAAATGATMRKIGDVINGPFIENLSPLVIVDDEFEPERASGEIGMLSALTRAVSASDFMRPLLQ